MREQSQSHDDDDGGDGESMYPHDGDDDDEGDEGDDDEGAYEEEAPPEGGLEGSRVPRAARAAGSRKLARPCHPPQYRHHQLTITVQ